MTPSLEMTFSSGLKFFTTKNLIKNIDYLEEMRQIRVLMEI